MTAGGPSHTPGAPVAVAGSDRASDGKTFSKSVQSHWMVSVESLFVLAIVLVSFLPFLDALFSADDFGAVAVAKTHGLDPRSFLLPVNEHLYLIVRAVHAVEYLLFGVNPTGYNLVNLCIHLANVALVMVLFRELTGLKRQAYAAGLAFGVMGCHFQAVTWISVVGFLLTTFWLLVCSIFFLRFLRGGRKSHYAAAFFAHTAMVLSCSWGVEAPLLLFALYVATDGRHRMPRSWPKGLAIAAPFALNSLLFIVLGELFVPERPSVVEYLQGADGMVVTVVRAFGYALGGIYHGYVPAFTGAYTGGDIFDRIFGAANSLGVHHQTLYIGFVLLALALCVDWSPRGVGKHFALVTCLALWVVVLFFVPAPVRTTYGFEWFASAERYRYVPGPAAACIAVLLLANLKPFTRPGRWRAFRIPAVLFLVFLLLANVHEVSRRSVGARDITLDFEPIRATFVDDLSQLLADDPDVRPVIPDSVIANTASGMSVTPSILATLYLEAEQVERVTFLSAGDTEFDQYAGRLYHVVPESGRLYLVPPRNGPQVSSQTPGLIGLCRVLPCEST